MKTRLFAIPASHPSWTARLMLERKGIDYKRTDLVKGIHQPLLRAAGFPAMTVPAIRIDGERVQGSREISRALDRLVPDPPLFPAGGEERTAVEEAERWGDEVLQPVPRRIAWATLKRGRGAVRSYLDGARLGVPTGMAAATAAPIIAYAVRHDDATDEHVRADLAELPSLLDRVESLIAEGVIGGTEPNAADFQIAPSIALLRTLDDLKPLIDGRPAAELASSLVPDFPGHSPRTLPAEWLPAR